VEVHVRTTIAIIAFVAVVPLFSAQAGDPIFIEYSVANPSGYPQGSTHESLFGSHGNVWITQQKQARLDVLPPGQLDPKTTRFSVYRLPNPASQPIYISAASGQNLWFTELNNNLTGRITPDDNIIEIKLPGTNSRPIAFLEGPPQKIWFSAEAGHGLGIVDRDGKGLKTYPARPTTAEPAGLVFDRINHPWQQYMTPDMIGRVNLDMSVTPYCIQPYCIAPNAVMHRTHLGPGQGLWFTGLDRIDKLDVGYLSQAVWALLTL
jgi:streptogramin lyase